jgi:hypothetical protein
MGGRAPESVEPEPLAPPGAPPVSMTAGLVLLVFAVLVANGRPIPAGDTQVMEHVAASLVGEGDFDLDEYPEVGPPFARVEGGHRVSVYPVLPAVLAAPVFLLAQGFFLLDATGSAVAGKLAAALLSSLASGVFFVALARRQPLRDAARGALVLALGTTVFATSQALWQHPAAVLFLCVALLFLLKAEDDPAWAGRAGLPLALAAAARHADVVLIAVLALGVVARWPRRLPALLLWAAPVVGLVLAYNAHFFGSPFSQGIGGGLARFSAPWGEGHLGLLVSPAKGLLIFTPVALVAGVGVARAFRRGERWLASTLLAAATAHWLLMGKWGEWHGGTSFGPRLLTDALPLVLLFLPEGLDVLPRLGALLAAVSVSIQLVGAFAYENRWEILHESELRQGGSAALWRVGDSPLALYLRERVAILALPGVREGRAFVREHPIVVLGPTGSQVRFEGGGSLRVEGSEQTLGDVHLQGGARVVEGRAHLKGRRNALFLRVRPGARQRRLELRVQGRGQGPLFVGEQRFDGRPPRWTEYPMRGAFAIRHPYYFAESGGEDLLVAVGKGGGEAFIEAAALVPPREPDDVIRLP